MIYTDYNMSMIILVLNYKYSAYRTQIKACVESNRSPLCRIITWSWWQLSLSLDPWSHKCPCHFFCGRQSVFIELHSDWRHLLGDNVVDHVVFLKAEFLSHTFLSNKYVGKSLLESSVCFSTWWSLSHWSSGISLVFWWRDTPLVHGF